MWDGMLSWRCTVIPESLVLLLDGVYSPKIKGANWLKFTCHQGRSLVNNFSLCNNWYKSVVLPLIWSYSLVCQIHNKQMSQLVAYSGNICVSVVSCNECGGWQFSGWRSASINDTTDGRYIYIFVIRCDVEWYVVRCGMSVAWMVYRVWSGAEWCGEEEHMVWNGGVKLRCGVECHGVISSETVLWYG